MSPDQINRKNNRFGHLLEIFPKSQKRYLKKPNQLISRFCKSSNVSFVPKGKKNDGLFLTN